MSTATAQAGHAVLGMRAWLGGFRYRTRFTIAVERES
jgi:hypothetical protein